MSILEGQRKSAINTILGINTSLIFIITANTLSTNIILLLMKNQLNNPILCIDKNNSNNNNIITTNSLFNAIYNIIIK